MKAFLILTFFFISVNFYSAILTPHNLHNKKIIVNKQFDNKIYKSTIKTVLIHKKGWELSFPIINLDSDEQIELLFDELGVKAGDYSWSIIHCNINWEQDALNPIEYLSGFESGNITEIAHSQNTITNYVNYRIEFPNQECKFSKSGNYIIKVFERNNPEKLILIRRFYIIESIAEVSARIDQLRVNINEGLNQRVNIDVKYNESDISNPSETIALKVIKNQELEKTFVNIKPSAISDNEIKYENLPLLCFSGGNEYRHFDIKSVQFLSDRLQNIEKKPDGIDVFLTTDENLSKEPYKFKNDINGRNTIKLENSNRSNIMADYCNTYFRFDSEISLEAGDYYIYGALSNWAFDDYYKMNYDFKQKMYTCKLFLKQGYYNYLILFKTEDDLLKGEQYLFRAEGNYFETENDYQILVYYNDISMGSDRLIASVFINSSNSAR